MFYYIENYPEQLDDTICVNINQTFCGIQELFGHYGKTLRFPYNSITNFSAFRDVMGDLEWLPEKNISVFHDGLPSLSGQEMNNYLDVLNLIDVEWERFMERAGITRQYAKEHPEKYIHRDEVTAWWERQPKIFNVYFRKEDESYVKEILQKYSKDYRMCLHYDEKGNEIIDY